MGSQAERISSTICVMTMSVRLARKVAIRAALETAAPILGIEYSEGSDYVVVQPHARVGVKRQGHIDGDPLARLLRQTFRTARERINPMGARHVVVLVIVRVLLGGVDILGEARPLEPIARALAKRGYSLVTAS